MLLRAAIVALIFAGSAHAASVCSWNKPGADPTTSDPLATLRTMGIDNPRLAQKIRDGDYDELVTIRKNDTRIHGMSSGNAKWCNGTVDTSQWAEDYAEQGRVFSDGKTRVMWAWRCRNLMLWLPEPVAPPGNTVFIGTGESFYTVPPVAAGPIGSAPAPEHVGAPEPVFASTPYCTGPVFVPGIVIVGGPGIPPIITTPPIPPVTPVPEPSTWVFLLLGLCLMAWRARRPI